MGLNAFEKIDALLKIFAPKTNGEIRSYATNEVIMIIAVDLKLSDKDAVKFTNEAPRMIEKLLHDRYLIEDTLRKKREGLGESGKTYY